MVARLTAADRAKRRQVVSFIPKELYQQFKIVQALTDDNVQGAVEKAVEHYVKLFDLNINTERENTDGRI